MSFLIVLLSAMVEVAPPMSFYNCVYNDNKGYSNHLLQLLLSHH